jgi:prolyl-tRNA editing enzyme YbaK/EbsC (Cys-tRNA(Pro) deacylase)
VGGGSIRSHKPEVLQAVFEILGHSPGKIEAQFGHMLEAFKLGTPPHGGCAHGFERLLMALFEQTSIHEVQAFPQTGRGRTSVMDAPSPLTPVQLAELGLTVSQKKAASAYDYIIDLLKSRQINFRHYEHEPVFTSEDAVRVRGDVNLHQGAKALVLQKDKDLILFVTPGDVRVDFASLKAYFGAKRLVFASKDTVKAKTGLEVGSIPPLGSAIGLPTYVDSRLADNTEIAFNAGRLDRSIKMKYSDYLKIEKPTVVVLT